MTGNPSEYLTLPAGGASNYIYKGSPSNSERWGKPCRGEFNKVRIVLRHPIRIVRSDITFMKTDKPNCSPLLQGDGDSTRINGYGGAGDCKFGYTGKFQINLSGTLFKIPSKISWKAEGYQSQVWKMNRSIDGKTVSVSCGGYCGRCNPSSGDYIPLDLQTGSHSNFFAMR